MSRLTVEQEVLDRIDAGILNRHVEAVSVSPRLQKMSLHGAGNFQFGELGLLTRLCGGDRLTGQRLQSWHPLETFEVSPEVEGR